VYFWDRIFQIICSGWPWTLILLISVSWVAWTTGVSHQYQLRPVLFKSVKVITDRKTKEMPQIGRG
jgi:hypothetical protein